MKHNYQAILSLQPGWKRNLLIALSLFAYKTAEVRLFAKGEQHISSPRGELQLVTRLPSGRKENEICTVSMQEKTSLARAVAYRDPSPGHYTSSCSLCDKESLDEMHNKHHHQNNCGVLFSFLDEITSWLLKVALGPISKCTALQIYTRGCMGLTLPCNESLLLSSPFSFHSHHDILQQFSVTVTITETNSSVFFSCACLSVLNYLCSVSEKLLSTRHLLLWPCQKCATFFPFT